MEENISTYEFLKNNIYNKEKKKLLVYPIKAEYQTVSNFLLNPKVLMNFFKKELNNIIVQTPFLNIEDKKRSTNNQYIEKDYNIFIIPNNNTNTKNDFFKVKKIFHRHYINHSMLILRFTKEEAIDINNYNKKDDFNFTSTKQILDKVISFYIDITDNSTLLINEIYSNLDEPLFTNFINVIHLFHQKLNKFIQDKINHFFCSESILISKKMEEIFNYLYSCKIFHDEKFQIKKIENFKGRIAIYCIIGSLFPVNSCEAKLCILSLSDSLCLVGIETLMNPSGFNEQEKLLNIKTIFSVFLKKLKLRINAENNN